MVSSNLSQSASAYKISPELIWKAPSNFTWTVFCSWKDIAYIFGFEEHWDLIDLSEDPPLDLVNAAFIESIEWANLYVQENDKAPDCDDLISMEERILKSICEHWSAEKIVPKNVNFNKLTETVNDVCMRGPTKPELFPIIPTSGPGLQFFENSAGISFTVFDSFLIPYTELYYEAYENLPEWNLEDLNGYDVVETIHLLHEKLNRPVSIDLNEWDIQRKKLF